MGHHLGDIDQCQLLSQLLSQLQYDTIEVRRRNISGSTNRVALCILECHKFFSGYDHCASTIPRRFATLKQILARAFENLRSIFRDPGKKLLEYWRIIALKADCRNFAFMNCHCERVGGDIAQCLAEIIGNRNGANNRLACVVGASGSLLNLVVSGLRPCLVVECSICVSSGR
jgi:hypothetical protein